MVKKDLYVAIPSFFRCPISLDVMKSPVSLSTGVTYDRATIQRWLDSGHNTCPATMQLLDSKDLIPNTTLRRLIQVWSHNNNDNNKFHSMSSTEVLYVINHVSKLEDYVKILCFASESPENRNFLASNEDFVTKLADLLGSEGSDLSPDLLEPVLKLFQIVTSFNNKQKQKVFLDTNPKLVPNLVKILKTSKSGFRVAVLSCLVSLSSTRVNKIKFIETDGVAVVTTMITKPDNDRDNNNCTTTELLLTLLEMLVGCTEGRAAITNDPKCVFGIVDKLMNVSKAASEHAMAILWSLCYLFRDQKARETMSKSNGGLTKILLLMQSDCSPAVKRMCCDLLRVFKVSSKSCLSSYDSKTTHIMPC